MGDTKSPQALMAQWTVMFRLLSDLLATLAHFLPLLLMSGGVFFKKPTFNDIENAIRSKPVPVENIH